MFFSVYGTDSGCVIGESSNMLPLAAMPKISLMSRSLGSCDSYRGSYTV